jgi:ankyrin repeat protein
MQRDSSGWTALHWAAHYEGGAYYCGSSSVQGNATVIETLHEAGGNELLHAATPDGQTALHLAALRPDSVQKLCELGALVDARDSSGQTALHKLSCTSCPAVCVQTLTRFGASMDAHSALVSGYEHTGGWQPLHFAVMQGFSLHALDTLLQSGAYINAETAEGCTAAWLAARYKGWFVLEQLIYLGADEYHYSPTCGSLLHAAAGSGDVLVMLALLDRGLQLATDDVMYRTVTADVTPLHCAAQAGHIAMVQLLIDNGCDVRDADVDGNTALRLCLQGDRDDAACFQLLVTAGSDVFDTAGITRYMINCILLLRSVEFCIVVHTEVYVCMIVICFACAMHQETLHEMRAISV